jgi:hypothetical protein
MLLHASRSGKRARNATVLCLVLVGVLVRDAVAATTPAGSRLWLRRYDGPGVGDDFQLDRAYSVAASPDGTKVFVTGESGGSTGSDYATLAYDASSGARLWTKRYNDPPTSAIPPSPWP